MRRFVLSMVLLAACAKPAQPVTGTENASSGTPAPAPAPAPMSAPVASGPRVILPDGFAVNVELAVDDDTRAQGLMYRDHLAAGEGMLFLFPESGEYPFWMKNTRIPLDIIWIDSARRITHVKAQVPPCHVADCPSYPPNAISQYVLELAGGEAQKHGLKVGDTLQFERTENIAVR